MPCLQPKRECVEQMPKTCCVGHENANMHEPLIQELEDFRQIPTTENLVFGLAFGCRSNWAAGARFIPPLKLGSRFEASCFRSSAKS